MSYTTSAGSRLAVLNVGQFPMDVSALFPDAPEDQLDEALTRHHYKRTEPIFFQVNTLYVRMGSHHVLVDPNAGLDTNVREPGPLLDRLGELGIEPADIDTVVVTHFHPDHYTGCVDADCRPLFPEATCYVQRSEWENWENPDHPEADFAAAFRQLVRSIRDRFVLLDGDQPIIDGVEAIGTPGHSAGHMSVLIDDEVLVVGDALINMIHLEHPEWLAVFEQGLDHVFESRRKLLELIIEHDLLVYGSHYPWPGLGRVEKLGTCYGWVPETA
ncbi:MAG: MBL fold metallo-hydrolase [Anaerolineae bacterium]|nr:MBL fold metallo-hydrolase [Anaerolineae bacterium]